MKNINNNTTAIIAGDFNIDLIDSENSHVEQCVDTILQNSFIPCITIPTRITDRSATLIDHILLKTTKNHIHTKVSAGNLMSVISDYLPNFIYIDLVIQKYKDRPLLRLFTCNKIPEYCIKVLN